MCVCLHLLVIGRRRERGGECPLLALMKELSVYHKETRGQSRRWSGHNQTWYKVWTTDSHEVCVCVCTCACWKGTVTLVSVVH